MFLEHARELVKGIVAVSFTATLCYMAINNIAISNEFMLLGAGVVGTYFGINVLDKRRENELQALRSQHAVLLAQATSKPVFTQS